MSTTTPRTESVTLRVDWLRCDGHGICAEVAPELIHLDDWGYPIIDPRGVPAHLSGVAREAVNLCPALALRLAGG
ncbi:MAG: ferredoxin [Actinomycetes bacterium]